VLTIHPRRPLVRLGHGIGFSMIKYLSTILNRTIHHPVQVAALILLVIIATACSTKRTIIERSSVSFDRWSIALMTVPTSQAAERLRESLLRGERRPPSTTIIPITKLSKVDPGLITTAIRLSECEVSSPIESSSTHFGAFYFVLQRGGTANDSCEEMRPTFYEQFQKISDIAGQILIGLIAVGVTGFLIAAPFLFDIF
jgi:hypothetical protein